MEYTTTVASSSINPNSNNSNTNNSSHSQNSNTLSRRLHHLSVNREIDNYSKIG
jgi:hypothetical protein